MVVLLSTDKEIAILPLLLFVGNKFVLSLYPTKFKYYGGTYKKTLRRCR